MNSNFGLLEPLEERVKDKHRKRELLVERAQADFAAWMAAHRVESAEAAGVR
jgi:folate-dependent tRNA-U54 methylase TrmFO/GidA